MTGYHESNEYTDTAGPSMNSDETNAIPAYLAGLATGVGASERVAKAVALTFEEIEEALTPIVGQRGVAALYKRSLHLTKNRFPWLPDPQPGVPMEMDIESLKAALAQQTKANAAIGGAELLQAFHDLLTALIGPVLAERLLRSVWITFLSGPTARENTQ